MLERYHPTTCTISNLIVGNSYSFRVFSENLCGLSTTAAVTEDLAHIQKAGGYGPRQACPAEPQTLPFPGVCPDTCEWGPLGAPSGLPPPGEHCAEQRPSQGTRPVQLPRCGGHGQCQCPHCGHAVPWRQVWRKWRAPTFQAGLQPGQPVTPPPRGLGSWAPPTKGRRTLVLQRTPQ